MIEKTVSYFKKVGHRKAFEELQKEWEDKKIQKPTNIDYIVDEWFEEVEENIKSLNSTEGFKSVAAEAKLLEKYSIIKKGAIESELTFEDVVIADEQAIKRVLTHDHDLTDCEFWKLMAECYIVITRQFDVLPLLKAVFASNHRKDKHCLMTKSELEVLESLPDEIEIFRGMTVEESKSKNYGMSWSLNKEVAEFFAYEHPDNQFHDVPKTVVSVIIPKNEVIAYLESRKEEEILWVSNE